MTWAIWGKVVEIAYIDTWDILVEGEPFAIGREWGETDRGGLTTRMVMVYLKEEIHEDDNKSGASGGGGGPQGRGADQEGQA